MADLSVTFAGKKLRTPLGVASHALVSPEHDAEEACRSLTVDLILELEEV